MTRSETMFKQGDIVLIPVPFSDLTNSKQRPVLVISSDSYNKVTQVVVAVTNLYDFLQFDMMEKVLCNTNDLK